MKRLLALAALIFATPALSATYYVDCAASNDKGAGTSPETAWQTIDRVNRSKFKPGDSMLLKRGCTWREQLGVIWSGSAGSPITFGAYGSGAAPVLDGSDLITPGSPWAATPSTASVVYHRSGVTTGPKVVLYNGTKLTENNGATTGVGSNEWDWDSNVLYINVGGDPSGGTVEIGQRDYVVWIGSYSYVVLDGLSVRGANLEDVHIEGTHITVQNCEASNSALHGLIMASTSADNLITGCNIHDNGQINGEGSGVLIWKDAATSGHENVISHNSIYDNSQFGIYVVSNYCIIEHNHVYDNGNTTQMCSGIEIWNGDNDGYAQHNSVRYNLVSGQESGYTDGEGIFLDDYSANNTVCYNLVYGCRASGIATLGSNHDLICNNTLYGNGTGGASADRAAGISVGASGNGAVNNITITNNVVYANQTGSYAVYMDSGSYNSSGLIITNNDWYSTQANWYYWNNAGGNIPAVWNALTGVGTDLNRDPLFTNAASDDFTLHPDSPCIDAGADLGPSYSTALIPGASWPQNVLTGDQYKTGRWWEIGAFLFPEGRPSTPPPTPAPTPTVRKHLPKR